MRVKCLYILVFLFVSFPLILYVYNFGKYNISGDPEKWAFFGDYVGGVYSVVLAGIITYLTYKLNNIGETKKEKRELLKILYATISEFNLFPLNNQEHLNDFLLQVYSSELTLNDKKLFRELISMYDYYLSLNNNTCEKDVQKEQNILNLLKAKYNE